MDFELKDKSFNESEYKCHNVLYALGEFYLKTYRVKIFLHQIKRTL